MRVFQTSSLAMLAGVDAQPLADQAAHGQPAEMHARQLEGIEQGKHVGAELADGVRSGGDQRGAVAAGVVAQHAEMGGECGDLRVPHAQVGAQRV